MKFLVIGFAAVGITLLGGILSFVQQTNPDQKYTACTLEAKICPDGSTVGRQGPKCEFAACSMSPELGDSELPEIVMHSGTVVFGDDTSITFQIPQDFQIAVAAEDLGRMRFMAQSPDGRLFVTDMKDLTDNSDGKIYVLENFNQQTHEFEIIRTYLKNLRNPNSIVFYTDIKDTHWMYIALTDKLVRYKYEEGDNEPHSKPELLATFPDYGLSYKHGGWHLTRTIAIHKDKLYVSVGSSCNSCEEKEDEPQRASILQMNMDGSNQKTYAAGLRNAVGLKWVDDTLYATEMGADHLGDDKPDDSMYAIAQGSHYGWPYCFKDKGVLFYDASQEWERKNVYCKDVPDSFAFFKAHSAPLGFEYFSLLGTDPVLQNTFLVALHGSGNVEIGNGYEIVRVSKKGEVEPFITGFLHHGDRVARPVDILQVSTDSFFFTDDFGGRIFYLYKQ